MIWILAAISLFISFIACITVIAYVFIIVKKGHRLVNEIPCVLFGVPISFLPIGNLIMFATFSCLIIYELFGSKFSSFLNSIENKIR